MKKYIYLLTIVSIFAILLLSCAPSSKPAATLGNVTWVMEKYGETSKLQAPVANTEITIKFDSTNANFSGSAGCNRYFGGYRADQNKLTIVEPIGSTKMACDGPIMNQETEYLSILDKVETYRIEGEKLTISCGGKILVYALKK